MRFVKDTSYNYFMFYVVLHNTELIRKIVAVTFNLIEMVSGFS